MEYMLMPLKRYADFSGRSRRMEFWMWQLFKFAVVMVVMILMMVLGGAAIMGAANGDPGAVLAAGGIVMILYLLLMLFGLAIIIPDIAVAVRRLHDTDRSGWWFIAPLAPYVVALLAGGMAMASPDAAGAAGILALLCMLAVLGLAITLLVFYFTEGTRGPNRYGPDPKGAAPAQAFT